MSLARLEALAPLGYHRAESRRRGLTMGSHYDDLIRQAHRARADE
jgi:hypothetical protein